MIDDITIQNMILVAPQIVIDDEIGAATVLLTIKSFESCAIL